MYVDISKIEFFFLLERRRTFFRAFCAYHVQIEMLFHFYYIFLLDGSRMMMVEVNYPPDVERLPFCIPLQITSATC